MTIYGVRSNNTESAVKCEYLPWQIVNSTVGLVDPGTWIKGLSTGARRMQMTSRLSHIFGQSRSSVNPCKCAVCGMVCFSQYRQGNLGRQMPH